ncbi:MAG: response regulator [Bacteroidales bacterium]|jgi:DNA-binding response OmpR family regulator|nr:response regulator [Bacteroidales bacterium]
MKILVVDDSTVNNILLQDFLENNGFDVETSLSGNEALKIIENQAPDLVLLDLMMPGISGFDVLKVMKRRNNMPPTIVISAYNETEKVELTKRLGAIDYLKKPIEFNHLLKVIDAIKEHV